MSMSPNDPSDRRSFLSTLATGSAALAASGMGLHFSAAQAHSAPLDAETADHEAWLTKLNGKHRQFVDAYSMNDGFPLGFALNFLNANNDASKVPDSNLSAVVGMRHFAIPMVFTDTIWARYKLGEFAKVTDPMTKAPATRNIFYHPHDGDLLFPAMAVDKLQARGVQFTVCNVALTVLSGMMSKSVGVSAEEAKKEWVAGLIPGVVIVPSGVWAVNRAQEKGCTYCSGG